MLEFLERSKQKFQHNGFSHNSEAFLSASYLYVAASKSELECWSSSNTFMQHRFGP